MLIIESIDMDFDDSNDIEFGDGSEVVKFDYLSGVNLKNLHEH